MKIVRVHRGPWGPVQAYIDVDWEEGNVRTMGIRVMEENGLVLRSPVKFNKGSFYDMLWLHPDAHEELMRQYLSYKGE